MDVEAEYLERIFKFIRILEDIGRAYSGIGMKRLKSTYKDILVCNCQECQC